MITDQQVKVSMSIVDTLLALSAKHQRPYVEVATEDLQAIVDEIKRLSADKGEWHE